MAQCVLLGVHRKKSKVWNLISGTLANITNNISSSLGNKKNTDLIYSDEISLGKYVKVHTLSAKIKVIRSDIGDSTQSGTCHFYGVKGDETRVLLGSITSSRGNTSTATINDTETEFHKIYYEFYYDDTISRAHTHELTAEITQWYERG